MSDFERYVNACDYPGRVDEAEVTRALANYLSALGVSRKIVRLRRGWTLDEYPGLARTIMEIAQAAHNAHNAHAALAAWYAQAAQAARAALADLDAQDARYAQDALAAQDTRYAQAARAARYARYAQADLDDPTAKSALQRFTQWCIFRNSLWGVSDISWLASTYIGACERHDDRVQKWSKPVFDAFVDGCWLLCWTNDVLYWIAKPVVHIDTQRRLHCENGPALVCDIEDLYFWRGVLVPQHWIENLDHNEDFA